MAYITIHPIYSTLKRAMEYITDEKKGDLVSYYGCYGKNAFKDFLENQERWDFPNRKVLARHLIISFAPGEATAEEAHETVEEFLKVYLNQNYFYVHSTHEDKAHIHSHVIFDNVCWCDGRCYNSNKKEYAKMQLLINDICMNRGLSVIEHTDKNIKKISIKELNLIKKNGKSYKEELRKTIKKILPQAESWEDFLRRLEKENYEIKFGKYISCRKISNAKRFTRLKTLGENYSEEKLKLQIEKNIKVGSSIKFNKRLEKIHDSLYSSDVKFSAKQKLRYAINQSIYLSKTFEQFLLNMDLIGYELNPTRTKRLSWRLKNSKEIKYTRMDSLGKNYSEIGVRRRILKNKASFEINDLIKVKDKSKEKIDGYFKWIQNENIKIAFNCINELKKMEINYYNDNLDVIIDSLKKEIKEFEENKLNNIKEFEEKIYRLEKIKRIKMVINKFTGQGYRLDDLKNKTKNNEKQSRKKENMQDKNIEDMLYK